jgi:hypothetical protein
VKNRLSIFISGLLALFVLGASTSWTFDTHYCGSIKIDSALFGTPETCGMEMEEGIEWSKPSCCNEIAEVVEPTTLFNPAVGAIFIPVLADYVLQTEFKFDVVSRISPIVKQLLFEPPPPNQGHLLFILHEAFLI